MRKLLIIFCMALLVFGCKPTQTPYGDEEAKAFENKLKKANITIDEKMIGDFGTMRIVLNLPQTSKTKLSVEYYAAYVVYEQLKRKPFNFTLDIRTEYSDDKVNVEKPVIVSFTTSYTNYANYKLDKDGKIGAVVDPTTKMADGGWEYCIYLLDRSDYSDWKDIRRCSDKEEDQIVSIKEEKEKIYDEAGISDDDVMRYYSWYVMKEKNIE